MEVQPLALPGIKLITPHVLHDARGFFFESFNAALFRQQVDSQVDFVQDNHTYSTKNVLRGLHYQLARPQGKLIRVVVGEIFDVAVDIRRHSPTFAQWTGIRLSAENRHQLWIPPGFAHGFLVMSQAAQVLYKTTDVWCAQDEHCIVWNDPELAIHWPIDDMPQLSDRDRTGCPLSHAALP